MGKNIDRRRGYTPILAEIGELRPDAGPEEVREYVKAMAEYLSRALEQITVDQFADGEIEKLRRDVNR